MASANSYDLGRGPMLVEGFVFDVGKTDIAHLLRQGHLGGEVSVAFDVHRQPRRRTGGGGLPRLRTLFRTEQPLSRCRPRPRI